MPKLLRATEIAGYGATIELDNGDVISVSIARSVLVTLAWRKQDGVLKRLFGSFVGQKLYNEARPYKNAKTAEVLLNGFPDQPPELRAQRFINPVLEVFATAVWHCSSAAQVCVVLNAAADSAAGLADGMS
jgi:hypothetical protein